MMTHPAAHTALEKERGRKEWRRLSDPNIRSGLNRRAPSLPASQPAAHHNAPPSSIMEAAGRGGGSSGSFIIHTHARSLPAGVLV